MAKVHFVLGRAHAGKSTFVYDNYVKETMAHDPRDHVFLVPDQMTLNVQKALIKRHPQQVLYKTTVCGFTRLAYRLLSEHHKETPAVLDEIGKMLLLQKVMQNLQGELSVFAGQERKPGFLMAMGELMSELTEFQITDDAALTALASLKDQPLLTGKMTDLLKVRKAYESMKAGLYVTSEDLLQEAMGLIRTSEWLQGSHIIIDSFSTFTPIHMAVLAELMLVADAVTVVLDMDEEAAAHSVSETHLFREPRRMMERIGSLADRLGVPTEVTFIVPTSSQGYYENPAMAHLEKNYEQTFVPYATETDAMTITAAQSLDDEIDQLVAQMMAYTEQGYHYRDMAVVTTNLEAYAPIIEEKFLEVGIPYFSDHRRSLFHHIGIEAMLAALRVVQQDFSYDSVFRYVKCGLFDSWDIHGVLDLMDLYVRATGLRGKSAYQNNWTERKYRPKRFTETMVAEMETVKDSLMEPLLKLAAGLKKPMMLDKVRAIQRWMEDVKLLEEMEDLQKSLADEGKILLADMYAQSDKQIDRMLSQLTALLGETDVTTEELAALLEQGFSRMGVGLIPNYLDHVVIADLKRSRLGNVKLVFVIGMNDKVFPGGQPPAGLITDHERECLGEWAIEMNSTAREQSFAMKYYLYRCFAKASHRLHLSYALTGEDQKPLQPSYVVEQLHRLFPAVRAKRGERVIYQVRQGLHALANPEDFSLSKEEAAAVADFYAQRNLFRDEHEKISRAKQVMRQPAEVIEQKQALAIFRDNDESRRPVTNVSRLEKYASCPMQHFMNYGLDLKPLQEHELSVMDVGNLYHEALDDMFRTAKKQGIALVQGMDETLLQAMVKESLQHATEKFPSDLLESSAKNRFLLSRMEEVLQINMEAILAQMSAGSMSAVATELTFGEKNSSRPPLDIPGSQFLLNGKIDRYDSGHVNDTTAFRVVDYKSGSTEFSLKLAAEGLQLQLLLYLSAVQAFEKEKNANAKIGGAYYYHIREWKDLMQDQSKFLAGQPTDEALRAKVKADAMAALRLDGMTTQELSYVTMMDRAMEKTNKKSSDSQVVKGLSYNYEEQVFGAYSKVCSQKQFMKYLQQAQEKAVALGNEILSGRVDPAPYAEGERNSCTYCAYSGICGFDTKLGHQFRALTASFDVVEEPEPSDLTEKG